MLPNHVQQSENTTAQLLRVSLSTSRMLAKGGELHLLLWLVLEKQLPCFSYP